MNVNPPQPGWWMASDLKWYPPEQHSDPDYRAQWASSAPFEAPTPASQTVPSTADAAPPTALTSQSLYPASPPTVGAAGGTGQSAVAPAPVVEPTGPPLAPVATPPDQWPSSTAMPADPPFDRNRIVAIGAFVGAAVLITGAFLPWVDVLGELSNGELFEGSLTGWQRHDGKATVALGVVVAGIAGLMFVGWRSLLAKLVLVGAGVGSVVLAVVEAMNLADEERSTDTAGFDVDFTLGLGLWVTVGAGIALALLALAEQTKLRN